jgi:hypothetical protein
MPLSNKTKRTWRASRKPRVGPTLSSGKVAEFAYAESALRDAGCEVDWRNGGAHLVVDRRIDFWPGTGKWIERGNRYLQGRSLASLLMALGKTWKT